MTVEMNANNVSYKPQTEGEKVLLVASPAGYAKYKTKQIMKKDENPVVKGAKIGARTQLAVDAIALTAGGCALAKAKNTTFKEGVKSAFKGLEKLAGGHLKLEMIAALGIATAALIGAGIGKIVKNHQEKKQMQENIAAANNTLVKPEENN